MVLGSQPPERKPWETKFTKRAWLWIYAEVAVLLFFIIASTSLLTVVWWSPSWLGLDVEKSDTAEEFQQFALVFLAGNLGGTAFSMKWLHHAVGTEERDKGWSEDHRLWRFLVPILSAVIAVAFYAVLESKLLQLEITTENRNAFAVAAGFLIGYFSDRAAAKLREVAYVLFGKSQERGE